MSVQSKLTLKTYFETGDKPTEQQFVNLIDSLAHVDDVFNVGNSNVTNGVAGRIFFQNSSNKFAQDSNLHFDESTDSLGIGVGASVSAKVHAKTTGSLSSDKAGYFQNSGNSVIANFRGDRVTELYRIEGLGSGESLGIGSDPLSSNFKLWMNTATSGMYISGVDGGIQADVTAANAYGMFVNHSGGGGTAIAIRALVNGAGAGVRYGCYMNVQNGATGNNIAFYGVYGSLQLDNNDAIINNDARGMVLKSPDGHYWRIKVANDGTLNTNDLGTTINF